MADEPSKIDPPNSHPSNPIHKKAAEAQGLVIKKKKKKPTTTPATGAPATQTQTQKQATDTATDFVDTHHVNKALWVLVRLFL